MESYGEYYDCEDPNSNEKDDLLVVAAALEFPIHHISDPRLLKREGEMIMKKKEKQ